MNIQYVTNADSQITAVLIAVKDWETIKSILPAQMTDFESKTFWWKSLKENWKCVFNKIITKGEAAQNFDEVELQKIFELKTLSCNDHAISDLSPLKELKNLVRLHCEHNQIADLAPLSNLTSLTTLHCDHNRIADLSPINKLEHLRWLYCHNNQITDLAPLSNLEHLKTLHCQYNQISNLSALYDLKYLKTLYCQNNPIEKAQIEKFQEQHPNCKVIY